MRLSHFGTGLDTAEAQFEVSVLMGNLLGFDAWMVPHCLVPFVVAFMYDSLTLGVVGAYLYESLVVILHIIEYGIDADAERFYPYAGAISALIQDPLLGFSGALLGVICASRYGPVMWRPPALWGGFCLVILGVSAILSEVLWEPPPSAGLFAFIVIPLYVAPLWRRQPRDGARSLYEITAVLLWGTALINTGCLVAYAFYKGIPGKPSTGPIDLLSIGASVEEVGLGQAMLQTPLLWVFVFFLPAWRLLIATV